MIRYLFIISSIISINTMGMNDYFEDSLVFLPYDLEPLYLSNVADLEQEVKSPDYEVMLLNDDFISYEDHCPAFLYEEKYQKHVVGVDKAKIQNFARENFENNQSIIDVIQIYEAIKEQNKDPWEISIGTKSRLARALAILKRKRKREKVSCSNQVRYQCRSIFAQKRPRIKGKFISKSQQAQRKTAN